MAAPEIGITEIVLGCPCEWLLALHLAAPHLLGALVVQFAADDDAPPPLSADSMEGRLMLSRRRHTQRLRALLVPACHHGRLNGRPTGSIP